MRFTEQDLYRHVGNNRNALVCTRIDIEGVENQRVVLTVPVTKLRYFADYELIIRQPIPHMAQGLPLYIKAVEDKAFAPDVSVGFGQKPYDIMDNTYSNEGLRRDGLDGLEGEHGCDVEVIKERIEAKIYPVTMAPFGNLAFGEDLLGCHKDEPRPFITIYLNDQNLFVIRKCHKHHKRPKRIVKITEMITLEPKKYNAIDRDIVARPFCPPRVYKAHDNFTECGTVCHGNRHW